MNEMFNPTSIAFVSLLSGLIIGFLYGQYRYGHHDASDTEMMLDRQAWSGVTDDKGKFVKLV